ncbi:MAG TPA: shikimate dehydrogenase [Gemmatimonadaceae bacterium]|nr:shikimate dehydrogenase [Gemmatimonadaceae bacterium]
MPPTPSEAPFPRRLLLLGHPVSHSLSPRFQNAALEAAGLATRYAALDVIPSELAGVVATVRENEIAGNVTVPHKTTFFAYCDHLTPIAQRAGAVNTFWMDADQRLVGDNTDVEGFDELVRHVLGFVPNGAHMALFGTGGAAAAVCTATERWQGGASVSLWGRSVEKTHALAARYRHVTPAGSILAALENASIVVNATSVGMGLGGEAVPIDVEAIPDGAAVLDLVYRHPTTPFVRTAKNRGLRAADGLVMLIEQGALAFERWFGFPPDRDLMRRAVATLTPTQHVSA